MQQKEGKRWQNTSIKATQRSNDDKSKVKRLEMLLEDLVMQKYIYIYIYIYIKPWKRVKPRNNNSN